MGTLQNNILFGILLDAVRAQRFGAGAGAARFQVEGVLVEGTHHQLPILDLASSALPVVTDTSESERSPCFRMTVINGRLSKGIPGTY